MVRSITTCSRSSRSTRSWTFPPTPAIRSTRARKCSPRCRGMFSEKRFTSGSSAGPSDVAVDWSSSKIQDPSSKKFQAFAFGASWILELGTWSLELLLALRQLPERLPGHPEGRPVVERLRAEPFVELDRRRIPVEHRPFESPAAALDGDARERREQLPADPEPPELGLDEQILEIEAAAAEKRREVVEEHREPGGPIVGVRDEDLRRRLRAEERVPHAGCCRDDLVRHPLVLRETADQLEDQRDVTLVRAIDANVHMANSCRSARDARAR